MKLKFFAAALAVGLMVGALLIPDIQATKVSNPALARAVELYCPIACTGPDYGYNRPICTGFPVADNLVMTAGHCTCDEDGTNKLTLSLDGGKTWVWVRPMDAWLSNDWDAQLILVPVKPRTKAEFREAILGEDVAGFGIPWDRLGSLGAIVHIDPTWVVATNLPVRGMSGSALVGRDGKVIGMTVQGRVDERFASSVTYAVPGVILKQLVKDFKDLIKKSKLPGLSEPH